MQLHLGAHLSWYAPQRRSKLELPLDGPTPLGDVLRRLNLPPGEVALAVVNNELVSVAHAQVVDSDHVRLYPPVGAG